MPHILFLLSQLGRCLEENVEVETGTVKNVPVVCELTDVFLEELPELPSERGIEYLNKAKFDLAYLFGEHRCCL